MGASNKVCPVCGRKMKQQFIGLQHCKCGMSWKKDIGFFERTSDMVLKIHTLFLVFFDTKKYNGSCQRFRYRLYYAQKGK